MENVGEAAYRIDSPNRRADLLLSWAKSLASQRIIYNSATGDIFCDLDAAAAAEIKFAHIAAGTAFGAGSFAVGRDAKLVRADLQIFPNRIRSNNQLEGSPPIRSSGRFAMRREGLDRQ